MEETRYHVLASVLRHLEQGDVPTARHTLSQLLDHYINPADPAHLPYLLFAAAASRRLEDHRGGEINLYLRNYERPQIELFQLLADHFPVVPQAGGIANACLLRAWAGHEELTLLDIGIGTGQQEAELLREGARRGCLPRTLHLMAVEPNGDCLPDTRARLNDVAESLGLDLRFHTLVKSAEELSPEDWAFIAALPGPLTVLSAFAMHHLQDAEPQACAREGVFSRIRALNPAALVLCEPNSDHHRPGLFQRFQQAWAHYSALFRLIDSLDLPSDVTGALKTFFAREIEDVLGADETRCERHEPASAWVERLRRTGFRIEVPALENPRPHRGVAPVDHGDYVGLDYEDETLVAIIAASAEQGR